MKHDDARKAAENLIASEDMKNYTVKYAEIIDSEKWPNEWSVIFDVYSPAGNLIDGPLIVIVDKKTLQARFFEHGM